MPAEPIYQAHDIHTVEQVDKVTVKRLKKRSDFIQCRKGKRAHERAFVLQCLKRKDLPPHVLFNHNQASHNQASRNQVHHELRVGFTVTKKIGNAVIRNRIKRRLREALKQAKIPLQAAGHDVVLIARSQALDIDFAQLVLDISHGLAHVTKNQTLKNKGFAKNENLAKNKAPEKK